LPTVNDADFITIDDLLPIPKIVADEYAAELSDGKEDTVAIAQISLNGFIYRNQK
jgi:hypothetical protein